MMMKLHHSQHRLISITAVHGPLTGPERKSESGDPLRIKELSLRVRDGDLLRLLCGCLCVASSLMLENALYSSCSKDISCNVSTVLRQRGCSSLSLDFRPCRTDVVMRRLHAPTCSSVECSSVKTSAPVKRRVNV